MPGFKYEALERSGAVRRGVIDADTPGHARQKLRESGVTPVAVIEIAAGERAAGGGWFSGVPAGQLALVTRQFASLVSARLPIERALAGLVEQIESKRLKTVMAGVRGEVLGGRELSSAMRGFPGVFPPFYCAVVEAGERSGKLDLVLERLADYTEQVDELRRKVTAAMAYPAIITVVAFLAMSGLLMYVVPQVVGVFRRSHQQLPLLTEIFIWLSDFLRVWWWALAAAGVIAVIAARRWLREPENRRRFHRWLMRLPAVGWFARAVSAARLASTLAILVSSGVPLLTALKTAAGVVTLLPVKDALGEVIRDVSEGGGFSKSMAARREMFPSLMLYFISSGEESGELGAMLTKASAQLSRELEHRLATFTSLLEPALILGMGLMVLTIVLAVLLPIFEMNQIVR